MPSGRNRQARGGICRLRPRSSYWMAVTVVLWLVSTRWTAFGGRGFHDPHKVLGVSRRASSKEIKKCYRKLCLLYHPDKNVQKPTRERTISETKFKEVREAYDSILNKNYMGGNSGVDSIAETFFRPLRTVCFFICRPGLFLSEMRKVNLFAMGTPFATPGVRNLGEPDVRSVYVQIVRVPLEDMYKGVPFVRLTLKDNIFRRYWASIRGKFFFYSLYQASAFAFPLLQTSKVLAGLVGFYIVHGTTPIPDPKAVYATTIRRGTRGGEKSVRFTKWRQLEVIFRIDEAEHPIYRRVDNNLHAELTLTRREAKKGCTKRLVALDPTEEAIEIKIPAKKYSLKKEQKLLEHQHQKRTKKWRQERNKQQQQQEGNINFSLPRPYDNTIQICGRGWPIRKVAKTFVDHPDAYIYGDLIVTVKVRKPSPKKR